MNFDFEKWQNEIVGGGLVPVMEEDEDLDKNVNEENDQKGEEGEYFEDEDGDDFENFNQIKAVNKST